MGYNWWGNAISDFLDRAYNPATLVKNVRNVWNDITSSGSYSDYVSKANERTDGWYSTIAGAIPFASGVHNAILNRDRINDVLANTGKSWGDILGYNTFNATSGSSGGLQSALNSGRKIVDGVHDLYEFYAGEKASNERMNENIIKNMYG